MAMLERYQKFLEEFDKTIKEYFLSQKQYIKCQKGCTDCCETGEYPFSRLEAEYLMRGFLTLPKDIKQIIRENISTLKMEKALNTKTRFEYKCPFLIDKSCALYEYRGITCRVFGLAYLDCGKIKLPNCTNLGLNYSGIYNPKTKEITIDNPIKENLHIDAILRSPLAQKYHLECGEIRPLINWFDN